MNLKATRCLVNLLRIERIMLMTLKRIKIILFVFFITVLLSQSLYSVDFGIIPKIGAGFGYLSNIDNVRSREGLVGGIGFALHLNNPLTFELDVYYQLKGSQSLGTEYILHYLSIPVTCRILILEHLSVVVGSQFSFLLNAETNGVDVTAQTEPYDFNFNIGFSYYFSIGRYRLTFDFIIEVGVIDISKANHPYATGSNMTRAGYVTIGWEFPL